MSRRRNPKTQQPRPHQPPLHQPPSPRRREPARPNLTVRISLLEDLRVEVDPVYNDAAIKYLDSLYAAANREDYEPEWTDDHKIAYYIQDLMDGFLTQWEIEPSREEDDGGSAPQVPHIRGAPVVDRFDLADAELARSGELDEV